MNTGFDEVANKWDSSYRIKRAEKISKEIEKFLPENKKFKAMEFGCGTGLISFNLKNNFKSIELIDNSKGMIEVLSEKIKIQNIDHMNVNLIDLVNEKFNKNFDIIYTSMALHHIVDINDILDKFYSYINNKGYLYIVEINKDINGEFHGPDNFNGHHGFEQKKLKSLLEKNGFKNIQSHTFYHGKKTKGEKEIDYSLFLMIARKFEE